MPEEGWTKLSDDERRLARKWYSEGKKPSEIAGLLDRDTSTLTRLLVMQIAKKMQGRPPMLTKADIDYLERTLDKMIVDANVKKTITVHTLKKATKCKASTRAILEALHARNIYFRKLREKPVLTPEDIKARYKFATTYRHKSKAWSRRHINAFIDGKYFKIYLNDKERTLAAQHATYGAYRKPGKGQ